MSYKFKKRQKVFSVEEGYDLYAEEYKSVENYKFLDSFEEGEIDAMLGDLSGKKVLDAGCGSGRLIKILRERGAKITAIDISKKMLERMRKKYPDVEVVEGDVQKMPFASDFFDVIVAAFLIVHIKNLDEFFEECYRVLRPTGKLIVTNINQRRSPKLETKTGEIIIDSYYHRPKDVMQSLESAFFKIEKEKFVYDGEIWVNQIVMTRKIG